jgi:hypothetical protein
MGYDIPYKRLHVQPSKLPACCLLLSCRNGDLDIYTVAVDNVPTEWQEDPRWSGPWGGGNPGLPAHAARYPSRWLPRTTQLQAAGAAAGNLGPAPKHQTSSGISEGVDASNKSNDGLDEASCDALGQHPSLDFHLVDFLRVPKRG